MLAAAWAGVVRAAGAPADDFAVAAVGARLLAAYAEPHRTYHDLRHLAEVLSRVELLAAEAADPVAVRLAAWFHDAVYDGRADAEEQSAAFAETELGGLGLPRGLVDEVARLVRLTATHEVADGDRNGAVLSDADLGILAEPPGRYAEYAAAVREEYAALPDALFAAGRGDLLEGLLAREQLFQTVGARPWEEAARRNVANELGELRERAASGGATRTRGAG